MRDDPTLADATMQRDLGDGLTLRWSTAADTEAIAALLGSVHRTNADEPPNLTIGARTRMLMHGDWPTMGPGDFAVVQATAQAGQPLVACACLWHHTWEYAGIPLGVGRPEYVATDAAFRRKGLVRAIFAALHARSAAEGQTIQAITGIYSFYRQFGYEYALDLDGLRGVYLVQIPPGPVDASEPFGLRAATVKDIRALMALHAQRRADALLWSVHTAEEWRFTIVELAEMGTIEKVGMLQMIVDGAGAVVGYIHVAKRRWDAHLSVFECEVTPGTNWKAVALPLLRALAIYGQTVPNMEGDEPINRIDFRLGQAHPLYDVLGPTLAPYHEPAYAWYIRVADPLGFLRRIAPVLERRLAASAMVGFTGTLKLDWYRGGVQFTFAAGKLSGVEPWQPPLYGEEANAGCPILVFTQLLCGYRTLAELCAAFPDVWAQDEARLLLGILFPRQASYIID
ncbi:MAG: GNAT family N-acetyltransferase [Ktedonobacterales bacterium]|nr:GNAT family N-acetyltransferase [Ktedonobacterales bacterium]